MYEFSTSVPPNRALSVWQDVVCSDLLGVDCSGTREFSGSIRHEASGGLTVAELRASSHVAQRDRHRCVHGEGDFAVAFLQLEGRMRVSTDEMEYVVQPGDMFFYDARKPVTLGFPEAFRHLFIRAPWKQWGCGGPSSLRRSLCPGGSEPLLNIAGAASLALLNSCSVEGIDAEKRDKAIGAVVNLMSETIASHFEARDLTPAESGLTRRFEKVLADRLQDPELDVETLATALGVSSRYLNRVLVRSGGSISKRIFEARLRSCAAEIRNHPNVRIGDVAFRWGFSDSSHFSRVFKAFYGVSPRCYRTGPRSANN